MTRLEGKLEHSKSLARKRMKLKDAHDENTAIWIGTGLVVGWILVIIVCYILGA